MIEYLHISREIFSTRGQLSTTVFEALIGIIFIITVTVTVSYYLQQPTYSENSALEGLAADTLHLLLFEHYFLPGDVALIEIAQSQTLLNQARSTIITQIKSIISSHLFFYLETTSGTIGTQPPISSVVDSASFSDGNVEVTLRIWAA